MSLYTYVLRYDDGAAPNPFWGICTLAIRKPAIRLAAEVNDWIIGLGSAESPLGDISDSLVYAMKVSSKLTLDEYDLFCRNFLPKKMPDWGNRDFRVRMGDCIYNYAGRRAPKMRRGIHTEDNQEQDLSGKFALLSKQFYYFGDQPLKSTADLRAILDTNATAGPCPEAGFGEWIESLDLRPNTVLGQPQRKAEYLREKDIQAICSARDLDDDR